MFPAEGSGTITKEPLLPAENSELSFSLPDTLYPYSEDNLKYELCRHLSEHGECHCEVRLSDTTEAIDIVWNDGRHKRRVGIEVKTPSGLTKDSVTEQLQTYRNYTLADVLGEDSGLSGRNHYDATDLDALDELWVATYERSGLRSDATDHKEQFGHLNDLIDGHILFDQTDGEYRYQIEQTDDRESLWQRNLPFDQFTEPEAPYVALLWTYLRDQDCFVTAESPFTEPSEREIRPDGVQRGTRKQADLVAIERNSHNTFDCDESRITAIEVKPDLDDPKKYVDQLRIYRDSGVFSHFFLAFPHDGGGLIRSAGIPIEAGFIDELPVIGSVHYGMNHILTELSSVGLLGVNDPDTMLQPSEFDSDDVTLLSESKRLPLNGVPFIKFYSDGDRQWYSKC